MESLVPRHTFVLSILPSTDRRRGVGREESFEILGAEASDSIPPPFESYLIRL